MLAHKFRQCVIMLMVAHCLLSCSRQEQSPATIIWTDNAEIVSYVELFNATHESKALVIYKKEAVRSLPPAKDELPPDIVIAAGLKTADTKRQFSPVNRLFQNDTLSTADFYAPLLQYGSLAGKQYLIPISFNLPAMVFSKKNENAMEDEHVINPRMIVTASSQFNKKMDGTYTAMGYAPSWDSDFLYELTKLQGASYHEEGSTFAWNQNLLLGSINFIRSWTNSFNSDTTTEQNFQFKYLYMTKYRQTATERCLFTYMPSDQLFSLREDSTEDLSFRWLANEGKIMVKDDMLMLGIYRHAKNRKNAEQFIAWLLNGQTQHALLERSKTMKLDTVAFGLAGGFSSLKSVNNKIFPTYYRPLLGNLPVETYLTPPEPLPVRWNLFKTRILFPFLMESTNTETSSVKSLENRIADWNRQAF